MKASSGDPPTCLAHGDGNLWNLNHPSGIGWVRYYVAGNYLQGSHLTSTHGESIGFVYHQGLTKVSGNGLGVVPVPGVKRTLGNF